MYEREVDERGCAVLERWLQQQLCIDRRGGSIRIREEADAGLQTCEKLRQLQQ